MKTQKTDLPAIRLEDETRALLKLKDAAKHLSIDYGAMKVAIHRGANPVQIIKVGRRSYVRTNDLRRLAGLPLRLEDEQQGGEA